MTASGQLSHGRCHTDITGASDQRRKLFCAAVLDAYSRRIVGWSIDSRQDSALVINALDMAIRNRRPEPGGIVHADHGVQFTSWAFGDKIRPAGLMPSFGSVGDGLDNAIMEASGHPCRSNCSTARSGDQSRTRERDLRVHRDLPQPPAPTLCARLPHPTEHELRSGNDIPA